MSLFASDLPDDAVGDGSVPGSEWTPPPARAPRTGRFDLDEWDEEPGPTGGRRRWLLVAAVVPWVVVVAIMLTGGRGTSSPDGPPARGAAATPTVPAEPPEPASVTSPTPEGASAGSGAATDTGIVTAVGSPPGPHRVGDVEALALLTARSWLSTRPTGVAIDGLTPAPGSADRYVEHLAVESVDHPARGAMVVTVQAIVLPVDGDAYGPARAARVAVPVVVDSGQVRLGGSPWPLPATEVSLDPPERAPVDDPDLMLAAVDAIGAVGYRDLELVTLSRTSGWAWVAEVTAAAPGEEAVRPHELWLRSDVGRLVVAGVAAPDPARPPTGGSATADPSPQPSTEPTEVPS